MFPKMLQTLLWYLRQSVFVWNWLCPLWGDTQWSMICGGVDKNWTLTSFLQTFFWLKLYAAGSGSREGWIFVTLIVSSHVQWWWNSTRVDQWKNSNLLMSSLNSTFKVLLVCSLDQSFTLWSLESLLKFTASPLSLVDFWNQEDHLRWMYHHHWERLRKHG